MPRASKAQTEDAEAVDQKPYPTTPTKKKASSEQGSPSKNGKSNPWTPEETWNLFSAIYVKRDNLNWDEVAKAVGRDKKVRLENAMFAESYRDEAEYYAHYALTPVLYESVRPEHPKKSPRPSRHLLVQPV